MDGSSIPLLIVLIILLFLSAFFSSAETAMTMVNKANIIALAKDGKRNAHTVLKLIDNPSKLLSTILIGNNIVNLTASSITTILASQLGGMATGIATGILTFIILIFGEITPKTIATVKAEHLSLIYAPVILLLSYLLTPIIFFLNKLSSIVLILFRIDPAARTVMSEKELRILLDVSEEEGVIEEEENHMIRNVFDFGDSFARDVMIPRADIEFVNVEDSFSNIIHQYEEHKYTRMPVYEGDHDHVIGILNIKDLLYELSNGHTNFSLKEILWKPYFTSEFTKTSDLLAVIRTAASNMAIVLDEYGAVSGLITMEDLLEEIVGELRDEYDAEEENNIVKIRENEYEVDGSIRLDDLNDAIGTDLTSEDYDSIGGHMIELLDHLPKEGEVATEHNIAFKVVSMDKNRVHRIRIRITP